MSLPYRSSHILLRPLNGALVDLPAPINISYWWNFGSLLGLCLVIQLVTGIFLAMHYTDQVDLAFSSCVHISRDVSFGWLIRAMHANGASMFFLFLYLHIGRGIYYGSYRFLAVWLLGVVLFIAVMATAFLGYVLVWGQMSLWAATVITSLLSAVPFYGKMLVEWIWGGFSVMDATLHRFFVFHFILPFILVVVSGMHMVLLHLSGSGNPLGVPSDVGRVSFHPYFSVKDVLGVFIALSVFGLIILVLPDIFSEPENYIPANPLVTPNHIKPEWYFLWLYAILRAIPNKLGGVLALFSGILCLGVVPILMLASGGVCGLGKSFLSQWFFWGFVGNFLLLTWLGSCPAEDPFNFYAKMSSIFYFVSYLMFAVWNFYRCVGVVMWTNS